MREAEMVDERRDEEPGDWKGVDARLRGLEA